MNGTSVTVGKHELRLDVVDGRRYSGRGDGLHFKVEYLAHGQWTASATAQDGRAYAVHTTFPSPDAAADALAALIFRISPLALPARAGHDVYMKNSDTESQARTGKANCKRGDCSCVPDFGGARFTCHECGAEHPITEDTEWRDGWPYCDECEAGNA